MSESTYLSAAVQFIFPEDSISFSMDTDDATVMKNYFRLQEAEKTEILEYAEKNHPPLNQCCIYESVNGCYLLALLPNIAANTSDPLIIYLNIKPFFRYNFVWNLILLVLLLSISGVVLTVGSGLNRKAEESHAAEQRFFQNTSHELKTPLMAIRAYAEGILTGIEEPKEAARVILEENSRMTRLTEELLYITRIDSGSYKPQMKKTDFREVVYAAMNLIEPVAHANHIEQFPSMPQEAVFVSCDEEQMIKALTNILSNAVSHAKKKITVTCNVDKEKATVSIRDDGNGIDEESLPHIFERFYTTRKGETGIGLSFACEIIRLQKGELSAKNTEKVLCLQ